MLKEVLQGCNASFSFCIGVELEFYARGCTILQLQEWLKAQWGATPPFRFTLIEEEGKDQFELVFDPSTDILAYADFISKVRDGLTSIANADGINIDFSAKPDKELAGSAMHVHVSLYSQSGQNLFARNAQEESPQLLWSVAALLNDLPASMPVFSPFEEDYARYQHPDRNTPSTISWGGENRTVALRLPAVGGDAAQRRIEHRVPSPRADVHRVFAVIVRSILRGLAQQTLPASEKTHGNAWDRQYGLPPLPQSLDEAVQREKAVL